MYSYLHTITFFSVSGKVSFLLMSLATEVELISTVIKVKIIYLDSFTFIHDRVPYSIWNGTRHLLVWHGQINVTLRGPNVITSSLKCPLSSPLTLGSITKPIVTYNQVSGTKNMYLYQPSPWKLTKLLPKHCPHESRSQYTWIFYSISQW